MTPGTYNTKTIPLSPALPNVYNDARRAFSVLKAGGVVIAPTEVGYGLLASSAEAVGRAFAAKKRKPGHAQGIIGTYKLHQELHILDDRKFEMTKVLTQDLDMSFGVVAPYRADHPRLAQLTPETLENTTKNDTIAMFIGGGSFLE
jgi:tRNA A37 threonylcarbamoyladenosine synthetase subunit TsaC/SUA5/YrdC